MTTPAPLTLSHDGKLVCTDGRITITYSNPFPIPFCSSPGVTGKMRGAVLHTNAGFWQPVIDMFESKANHSGSAHFQVGSGAHDGQLVQFVPVGTGIETYHAFDANIDHYGIETEDGNNPHAAITDAGLWTWALVLEFLSRFAGFPLQLQTREHGQGLGYHRQFDNWNHNHHSCPGATMTDMVRVNQRDDIITRARQIRDTAAIPPRTPGHKAYAAYGDRLGWTDPASGLDIPFWVNALRPVQLAFEDAAKAVTP